jgi:hypothetical protein
MKAHAQYGVIPLVQPQSDQQFHSTPANPQRVTRD